MSDVLRAADALADAVARLRDPSLSDDDGALTDAVYDAHNDYRAARDAAPADEPTVGRLMPDIHMESLRGVRDELVSLRARVAETEPRTAEAQGWVDTRLKVVEALETAQAELADREDLMEIAQQEMDRLRGMNKRLRAELAETRAAGDALAHQATELTIYLQGVPNVGSSRSRLSAWIEQWRSVRGDAPTQPPAGDQEYAIIETNRGDGIEYPVAERNTNGPAGWRVGGELVPDSAVTHAEPVTVIRHGQAPAGDTEHREARINAVLDVLRKAIAATIGTTSLLPASRASGQLRGVAERCVDAVLRPGSLPPRREFDARKHRNHGRRPEPAPAPLPTRRG